MTTPEILDSRTGKVLKRHALIQIFEAATQYENPNNFVKIRMEYPPPSIPFTPMTKDEVPRGIKNGGHAALTPNVVFAYGTTHWVCRANGKLYFGVNNDSQVTCELITFIDSFYPPASVPQPTPKAALPPAAVGVEAVDSERLVNLKQQLAELELQQAVKTEELKLTLILEQKKREVQEQADAFRAEKERQANSVREAAEEGARIRAKAARDEEERIARAARDEEEKRAKALLDVETTRINATRLNVLIVVVAVFAMYLLVVYHPPPATPMPALPATSHHVPQPAPIYIIQSPPSSGGGAKDFGDVRVTLDEGARKPPNKVVSDDEKNLPIKADADGNDSYGFMVCAIIAVVFVGFIVFMIVECDNMKMDYEIMEYREQHPERYNDIMSRLNGME